MEEQPVALEICIRSPNSWVISLRYGVSPHCRRRRRRIQEGLLELTAALDGFFVHRIGLNGQCLRKIPIVCLDHVFREGFKTSAFSLAGQVSTQEPQPVQSAETCMRYDKIIRFHAFFADEGVRCLGGFLFGEQERSDDRMRAT